MDHITQIEHALSTTDPRAQAGAIVRVIHDIVRQDTAQREASLAGSDLADADTNPRARSIAGFLLARARWARRKGDRP